jgi:hypothetical protein
MFTYAYLRGDVLATAIIPTIRSVRPSWQSRGWSGHSTDEVCGRGCTNSYQFHTGSLPICRSSSTSNHEGAFPAGLPNPAKATSKNSLSGLKTPISSEIMISAMCGRMRDCASLLRYTIWKPLVKIARRYSLLNKSVVRISSCTRLRSVRLTKQGSSGSSRLTKQTKRRCVWA